MDVPSWHPANEDAAHTRRLLAASDAASRRTEFKLMPGSTADTSTDAGRELLSELTRGADGGSAAVEGRGFFDSSDRMYLQEQKQLEAEKLANKRQQDLDELRKFRATALKVQAQKTSALVTDVQLEAAKKLSSAATTSAAKVVIKTKKRSAPDATAAKPAKQQRTVSESKAKAVVAAKLSTAATKPVAPGALLLGYSCSDSDSEQEDSDSNHDRVNAA